MANIILWNCLNVDHAPVRPSGPHQLSHWLRLHGYTVKVIDFCHLLSVSQLCNITEKHIDSSTVAIGVSSTFWSTESNTKNKLKNNFIEPSWVCNSRSLIESKYPSIKWILGGSKTIYDPFQFNWVKIHGHAEDELLKFMDDNYKKTNKREKFDIKNLENCFLDDLSITSDEVLPIELSRGCQFKCRFCRYPLLGKKKNTYIRDYKLIEREFIENYERYGITKYFFLDDTVNESDEKIEALVNIAQRLPFKLNWFGYNRLDLIGSKPYTIELLKQSGLKSSFFGIESFHPHASKVIGKGWNGVHAKEFLMQLKEEWKNDINFHLAFIVGITGETISDIEKTQQWCIENDIPSWRFAGLHINKNTDQIYKSEFDLNYGLYGYKFPIESQDEYWTNKDWNSISARIKAVELTKQAQQYIRPAVWLLGEISTLGYDLTYLMNTYKNNLDWEGMKIRNKMFVEKYYLDQIKKNI